MTPERWLQIEQLFNDALSRRPGDRALFLDEACGNDATLRSEVESLLSSDEESDKVTESIPSEVAAQMLADRQSAGIVGRTIGRYLVLSPIGAGGMGEVYLAEDTTLKRKVALKVLPHLYTSDPERVLRFEQEARAASALNHPNIITIYEIGHWHDTQFIVTEFIDGQTLRQRIEKGPVSVDELLDIAVQAASALAAAHNAGIVHRDIKPANIMIRADAYVKILDFGLAKLATESSSDSRGPAAETDPGRVMGTINYMSPEQALGKPLDHRTDIFSLGVVLYELASGDLPFAGTSDAAVYDSLLNVVPTSLERGSLKLPVELAKIIHRTLEKDRNRRYQTAAELFDELKRLQSDSGWRAVASASPRSSNRVPVFLAAALLLLIAAAYVLSVWLRQYRAEPVNASSSAQFSFTQQTDQSGTEFFPTLSPDGQTLVYASQEAGNWDLWQETSGRRERINLTQESQVDDTQPAFSPDGKQIAFRSERDGGGLFIIELASKSVRKISNAGFNPTWSADGTEIAYGKLSVTIVEGRQLSQLWVVGITSGQQRLVTGQDAVQPAWSPHGQRIAFWGDRANLWTVPAGGGVPVQVTEDKSVNWNPCWSADGKYLYFTSDRNGSMNLWRVAIDESSGQVLGSPEPATTPATDMLHLAISRNGQRMAYVQRTKQRRLQSLAFDPVAQAVRGTPTFITYGTSFATHPSVSPDGNWLTYSSSGGPREDIFVVRKDGTGLRQLTNDIAKDRLPRWSPDGKRIAFFSDREGKNEIWSVDVEGSGAISQLTFAGTRAIFPTWSPDANQLAYYDNAVGSFVLDMRRPWQQQTPQPILLADKLDPDLAVWNWSRDGKKLACVKYTLGRQQISVAVYSFASQDTPPQLANIVENADYPVWLNDNRHLLFILSGKLYLIDVETKSVRELLAPNANEVAEYPALSPDNRTIYYSLATTEADIWLATTK
jgi:eukaryotic-like serine/threonine-protein kinase